MIQLEEFENLNDNISEKIDTVLMILENNNREDKVYLKIWKFNLEFTNIPYFHSQKNGFNNLINSANVNQIQNVDLMNHISTHYESIEKQAALVSQSTYDTSMFLLDPALKKLVSKKEFLDDLGYNFNTSTLSELDLSKNEDLIGGLIYKKLFANLSSEDALKWKERTIELIKEIETFIE